MDIQRKLAAAAQLLHCQVEDFIDYGERGSSLVVIAATGQKFILTADRLESAAGQAGQGNGPAIKVRERNPEKDVPAAPQVVRSQSSLPDEVSPELKKTAAKKRARTTRGKTQ